MGSSLGRCNEPATDHLPLAIADLNKCFTPQPEYSCGMFRFSRTQLNATASNDRQICLTVETRGSGRSLRLRKETEAHVRPQSGLTSVPASSIKTGLRRLNRVLDRVAATVLCADFVGATSLMLLGTGETCAAPDTSDGYCFQR